MPPVDRKTTTVIEMPCQPPPQNSSVDKFSASNPFPRRTWGRLLTYRHLLKSDATVRMDMNSARMIFTGPSSSGAGAGSSTAGGSCPEAMAAHAACTCQWVGGWKLGSRRLVVGGWHTCLLLL